MNQLSRSIRVRRSSRRRPADRACRRCRVLILSHSVGAGRAVEVDAGHRRLGALEHDVLGLLHVEVGLAQVVEDVREHARAVAVAHDEHVRRRRPLRQVDDVRHLAGLLVAAGRCGRSRRRSLPAPDRSRRRCDACRRRPAARRSRRLNSPVAAAGSLANTSRPTRSPLLADGGGERRVIDDLAARGVDEDTRPASAPRAARRRRGRASRRRAPGARSGCRRARRRRRTSARARSAPAAPLLEAERRALRLSVSGRSLAVEAAAPDDDVEAEAGGAPDHFLRDAADAEQRRASGRTARAPSSTPSCSTCRRAARRRCRECGDRARGSAPKRQLGDGDRVLARTVRDVDAARRGGRRRRSCCSRRRRAR